MRVPLRWPTAVAVGWLGALLLWALTGQISVVLLVGPIVYIAGDLAAGARKRRLQAVVDQTFTELVGDAVPDAAGFRGREAHIVRQHSRLAGIPPRLIDLRIVGMPDGTHYAVRAETVRALPDAIDWQVTRLDDREAAAVVGQRPA